MTKKKKKDWRNIYVLLDLKPEERTKTEQKRVERFLKAKEEIDQMEHQHCKNCGTKIPKPLEFCGSKCRREFHEKTESTKKDT